MRSTVLRIVWALALAVTVWSGSCDPRGICHDGQDNDSDGVIDNECVAANF
jgi:hypothetical protein